jgi:hypothetical protein
MGGGDARGSLVACRASTALTGNNNDLTFAIRL